MAQVLGVKRFAVNHFWGAALGLSLLVGLVTMVTTLGITGDLPDPRGASAGTALQSTVDPGAIAARDQAAARLAQDKLAQLNAVYATSATVPAVSDVDVEHRSLDDINRLTGAANSPNATAPLLNSLARSHFLDINILPGDDIKNVPPYFDHNGDRF